jgi:hypothetical protein
MGIIKINKFLSNSPETSICTADYRTYATAYEMTSEQQFPNSTVVLGTMNIFNTEF